MPRKRDSDQPTRSDRAESRSTRRTRTLRQRVSRLALSFAISIPLAELALRGYVALRGWTTNCYAAQLGLFRPHAKAGCDLTPGFRLQSGVYRVSINSLGLRGPEIEPKPPPGVSRIAILGESSAFGYFVSDGQEAARLLENRLRAKDKSVEVLNVGTPGYNLNQSTIRFREVVAPLRPRVVILYAGWNDLPYVTSSNPRSPSFLTRPIAPAWERLAGHSVVYGFVRYRLLGATPLFVPADFRQAIPTPEGKTAFLENLAELADTVAKSGAELVICAQASAASDQVAHDLRPSLGRDEKSVEATIELGTWLRQTLAEFAERRKIRFLDASTAIRPTGEFFADSIHLTAAGEEKLAEFWASHLADNP